VLGAGSAALATAKGVINELRNKSSLLLRSKNEERKIKAIFLVIFDLLA
jgi:hypothetical protein